MVKVLADNQVMAAQGGQTGVSITTDPIPMNGNDRFSAIARAHYLFGGGGSTAALSFTIEGSNDGTTWVDFTPGSGWSDLAAATSETLEPVEAVFAFIRMKFTFTDSGGSGNAFVCFDCHGIIDKS